MIIRILPAILLCLGACATTEDAQLAASAAPENAKTTAVAEAPAAEALEEGAVAEDENALDPDKMICKRQKVTGSRIAGRKVCMTRREWQAQADQARQSVDRFVNQSGGINQNSGN